MTGEGRAIKEGSGNWTYEYDLKDHLGNTRVSFSADNAQVSILQTKDYYPFGMEMTNGYVTSGNPTRYLYNGKELQDEGGLDWYDYGARFYDPTIGRWHRTDFKAELYKNLTPYCYAANSPVNAIDPDGNVVLFVNGQNGGDGGSSKYWTDTNSGRRFDVEVMSHFQDFSNPGYNRYIDGALGGWANTILVGALLPGFSNTDVPNRTSAGLGYGRAHAKEILEGLHRTGGMIDESVKVVSHSMGGAYSKGLIQGIIEYAETHPELSRGLMISEFDFDPYQAGSLSAVPKVHTEQYTHNGKKLGKWYDFFNPMVNIADERQKGINGDNPDGDNNSYNESSTEKSHSISTFFNDISRLQEGTYKWDGTQWVHQ